MNETESDQKELMVAFHRHRKLAAMASRAEALRAAIDHGLLEALAERKSATSRELAEACEVDPVATDILLRILQGEDVLSWDGEKFIAGDLLHDDSVYLHLLLWQKASVFLKTGERGFLEGMRPQLYKRGVQTLARWWGPAADLVVKRLAEEGLPPPQQILDFGAGSGTWSLPFVEQFPSACGTGFDLPAVVSRYTQAAEARGVGSRTETVAGDYTEELILPRKYDLIIVGMVLHLADEEGARSLVQRLEPWLEQGGSLLIVDAFGDRMPHEASERDLRDLATYELSLALRTHGGRPHSLPTYRAMVEAAGLSVQHAGPVGPDASEIGILWARKA